MIKNFKKCTYQEVAHLIPEDSFYAQSEDMDYLLCEGDWVLEKPLDLDGQDLQNIYTIIVTGNMTATQIYNEETDGSCGLVVLGDLSAQNIVVGGQEIFVAGNLKVDELYWGDYNHGELVVKGEIDIKAFIATDYSYDYERFQAQDRTNIRYHLCDEKDDNEIKEEGELIKKLFEKQCINTPEDEVYGWGSWLDRDAILKRLAKNKSVLLPEEKIKSNFEEPAKTWLFPNFDIGGENIKRMLNPKYFSLVKSCGEWDELGLFQSYYYLWNTDNIYFRLENETSALYIIDGNNDFVFYFYPSGDDYVVWFKVGEETDDDELERIDEYSNPHEYGIFKKHWESWLKLYSKIIKQRQKFAKIVNKENFEMVFNAVQIHSKKTTDKKTGETYYKIRSQGYDDGTAYQFYPPKGQNSGKIVAQSPPNYEYIYLLDNDLDRVKIFFTNDDDELEERNFDMFNDYTNAINFFEDMLSEVE